MSGNFKKQFFEKANARFSGRFAYLTDCYVNSQTKIKIKCPNHGWFKQTPAEHLRSKHACPKCSGNLGKTKDEVNSYLHYKNANVVRTTDGNFSCKDVCEMYKHQLIFINKKKCLLDI